MPAAIMPPLKTVPQLNYGLWDNLEVFAVIPFIQNWANRHDELSLGFGRNQ